MANTILHLPGAGEIYWAGNSPFTIKATAEETGGALGCLEISVPPGGGPVLHRHGKEDELFFVLEGTVTFVSDFGTWDAPPESLIYVPQGTLHTFENRTQAQARMLSIFLPGGFEAYFKEVCSPEPMDLSREQTVGEFQDRARAVGHRYQMSLPGEPEPPATGRPAIFCPPNSGEELEIMGDRNLILLPSEATGNAFCAFIGEAKPGAGVPPHIHFREDELFYVIEGNLTVMKPDGDEVTLAPGSFLFSPKGTPHAWFNRTNSDVRFLCVATPGGFDTFFRHIHEVSDPGSVIGIAGLYDIKFLPK